MSTVKRKRVLNGRVVSNTTVCLGVDPGASGGMVALWPADQRYYIQISNMPATPADILDWFLTLYDDVRTEGFQLFATLEKVGGYVPGSKGNIGSRMFSFGRNYGNVEMALLAAGVPHDTAIPNVWQRGIGLSPRKKTETKGAFKNRLKSRAQQLFPGVHITLDTADAILIAEYCRRKKSGEL